MLHLADGIRSVGPLSMVAQWPMETFAGLMNRHCHATSLFAESVNENVKYEASVRLFSLCNGIGIPYLDKKDDEDSKFSETLQSVSSLPVYDGICFRHPCTAIYLVDFESAYGFDLESLLIRFYMNSQNLAKAEATILVLENPNIVIWARMVDKDTNIGRRFIYRSEFAASGTREERPGWYISSTFQGPKESHCISYGKVLLFFGHCVDDEKFMLYVASWVTNGLHRGSQDQIFAKRKRGSSSLFSSTTVESVNSITHPIMVIEADVPWKTGISKVRTRTYFVYELRRPLGLLGYDAWNPNQTSSTLNGLRM